MFLCSIVQDVMSLEAVGHSAGIDAITCVCMVYAAHGTEVI